MQYCSAQVYITGTVSIPRFAVEDRLQEKYPEYAAQVKADEEGNTSAIDICTAQEEQEVFNELAREELRHAYDDAEPLDMNMVEIDLSTYRNR
jgi:hypothetical protein